MTLPPDRIGDNGQRYQIKTSSAMDVEDEAILGYADTREAAERMAKAWASRPSKPYTWVVDRAAVIINECGGENG